MRTVFVLKTVRFFLLYTSKTQHLSHIIPWLLCSET